MNRAVRALSDERRWALSGTPIYNRVTDLQSIFAYLRQDLLWDSDIWKRCVVRPLQKGDPNGLEAVKLVLRGLFLCRTKASRLDGKPIVQLPESRLFIHSVELNKVERTMYDMLYKRVRRFIAEQADADTPRISVVTINDVITALQRAAALHTNRVTTSGTGVEAFGSTVARSCLKQNRLTGLTKFSYLLESRPTHIAL